MVLYAASNGSLVPTFWGNLSIPFKDQAVQEGSVKVAGCCEHGNELSDSMKCGGFLDQLRNQIISQGRRCSLESVVCSGRRDDSTTDAKEYADPPALGLPAGQTSLFDPEHRTKHLLQELLAAGVVIHRCDSIPAAKPRRSRRAAQSGH